MAGGRQKGTPKTGGRQTGTLNKITRDLREMILGALEALGGQKYLQEQAEKNPTAFLALLGKVLPTTIAGDSGAPLTIKIIKFSEADITRENDGVV